MHPKKRVEFLNKGWSEKELQHAEAALEKTASHDVFFSKITFWSALIVIIFANLVVSLILIPFLIVLNEYILYFTVIVLAGTIGFLYNFLITDIGHLKRKHHLLASIIVPLLSLSNMLIMVFVSNKFIADLKIENVPHNPYVISIVFAVAFITPYFISKIRGKHHLTS